jgi:hypothetical protein
LNRAQPDSWNWLGWNGFPDGLRNGNLEFRILTNRETVPTAVPDFNISPERPEGYDSVPEEQFLGCRAVIGVTLGAENAFAARW